jgi:ubiquitin-conjugating enzyme E2 variant
MCATNPIHRWAHVDRPPRLAVRLQRAHLILDPAHHRAHHTPPNDRCYCITAGWWNSLLDRMGFFDRLERCLSVLTLAIEKAATYRKKQ